MMTFKKQILAIMLGLCTAMTAFSQTTIEGNELLYVVQPGDTLYEISELYLDDPKYWRGLAQGANVRNPVTMQPGEVIRLPMDLLRHEQKEVRVAFQRGESRVVTDGKSTPLARGMRLKEGQTIKTGTDGFVSLELPDESRLFLSANSSLKINQFRHVTDMNRDLVEFVLEEGSVETSVTQQSSNSHFNVSTPLTVTGVRGTKFGVTYDSKTGLQTNNVTEGAVDLSVTPQRTRRGTRSVAMASQDNLRLNAGQGAVMSEAMSAPSVGNLLPAPDLSTWPQYVHTETWTPEPINAETESRYIIRVSPKGAHDDVIFDSKGALGTIGPIAVDGVYQVQVRALDENGVPGNAAIHELTVKTKPVAPLLQTPENEAELVIGEHSLVCTNAPGIRRYFLQVATDKQFYDVQHEQISPDGCKFTIVPKETGVYYWRVASLEGQSSNTDASRGEFSAVGNFVVIPVPIVPTAAQERSDDGIVLRWVEETEGSKYVVQVSDQIDFGNVISTHETDETRIMLNISSSCKTLYVRIKSIEPSGYVSEYSDPRELQTDYVWCTNEGIPLVDTQGTPIVMK